MRKTTERDIKIGRQIQAAREAKELSRQALVSLLPEAISHQQLQKYEAGIDRVSAARLLDLAVALKVSITDLYHDPLEILTEELKFALKPKR